MSFIYYFTFLIPTNTMKQCSKCKEYKNYTQFSKCKSSTDGYFYYCKPCYKIYKAAWNRNGGNAKVSIWLHNTEKGLLHLAKTRKSKQQKYRESGKRRDYNRARKLKTALLGTFTKEQFNAVKETYSNMCACCGASNNLCADHIVSLANGGSNTINNIQPLCNMCNSIKNASNIDFRIMWILIFMTM